MTPDLASRFARIALGHVTREYPNKLDHVLDSPADAATPRAGVFRANMRGAEDYAAAVEALGPVDVLCSHAPPAVAELAYDVVARTHELTSPTLVDHIREYRPRLALYGHVHAPLTPRVRIGPTECVNVGHFRRRGTPAAIRW